MQLICAGSTCNRITRRARTASWRASFGAISTSPITVTLWPGREQQNDGPDLVRGRRRGPHSLNSVLGSTKMWTLQSDAATVIVAAGSARVPG